MRKLLITILSLLTALMAYVFLIGKFQKSIRKISSKNKLIINGMRVIENPFEETLKQSKETSIQDVVVANNNYHGWNVHKSDILSTIGVLVICILVIIVSFFSNKSRAVSESTEHIENKRTEASVINTLKNIEQTTISITKRVDSLDAHIKEDLKSQAVLKSQPKTQHGERTKK